ncbi:Enoyl-CoA hydratase/isomerase [Desulfacinum hydrothermale DSM 13146]|uniref:Enoyl-CoA hydratase/isomerase n=1 Tax=Desulfacinum hydrothermale DSM 13146 TaxID=1121390 RepID=A0A1W1WZJ1_9BACT|nr:Enoyl-CoA hydratase/isomerase [Desulfacinum hydrothermale DSM 13146]
MRLPRRIPYHTAMGLLLTGRRLSAQEALAVGLVNEVTAPEKLLDAARRWAQEMLACSPVALRATKEAAVQGLDLPLDEALGTVFPGMRALRQSEDYMEGARAFAEKRRPVWKGR